MRRNRRKNFRTTCQNMGPPETYLKSPKSFLKGTSRLRLQNKHQECGDSNSYFQGYQNFWNQNQGTLYCPFQSKRQLPWVIWRPRLNGQILEMKLSSPKMLCQKKSFYLLFSSFFYHLLLNFLFAPNNLCHVT